MNKIVLKNNNQFLDDLNDFCKKNQAEREIVSDDIKNEALEIVENLYPVSFMKDMEESEVVCLLILFEIRCICSFIN